MPKAIDQEALESPSLKVLDINNPPTKNIPHEHFPKMVYLHPKDKSKEHRYTVVHSREELEDHEKQGYKTKPHIPQAPPEDLSEDFEMDDAAVNTLDTMTKAQLIAEAKERGVEIDQTANKGTILAALKDAEANAA